MDTDCIIFYMKTKDIYWDIAKDIETRSDASTYELDKKGKKLIKLMKLGGKRMTESATFRPKTYAYLTGDNDGNQLAVDSLRENHEEFTKNNKSILKLQQRFRNKIHDAFSEQVNKITLSANDDKRIQLMDSIEPYTYGTSIDLVSKKEEIKCNNSIKQYKND